MLFALILIGLVLVLLTGVPVFAGLMLFATAMLYAAEGHLGGIGDLLFGVVSDTSIGALFMAGVVPGLMLAAIFAIYCMSSAALAKDRMKTEPRASMREIGAALRRSFWSLALPVIVLGGMYFGVFTA